MPLNEPSWWYGTGILNAWTARALSPVSLVYRWIADRRMARPNGYQAALPVICVGNFTAGGTGKTPFVCWVVGVLKQRGLNPAILTRGFGGRLAGPVCVERDSHTAGDVGDEPLLLAKCAPVVVARDRVDGLRAIAEDESNFDVVIMDDGLQNPSVHKDLSIAVVDGKRGFGNGWGIPAGPLRASLGRQAPRVSAVVINHGSAPHSGAVLSDAITQDLRRHGFRGPTLEASVSVLDEAVTLKGQRVLAYAGIGHPQRFFETVQVLGAELVEQRVFADHHAVTASEAQALLRSATDKGLTLVTTEKDWVRLSGQDTVLQELKSVTRVVPITMEISERDSAEILALLDGCFAKHVGKKR